MVWVMAGAWVALAALVAFVVSRSRTLVWFTRPDEVPPPLRAVQVVEPTAVLPPDRRELEQ